ncbi:magnesium transporter [Microbacterium sp. NPDC055988]|uniref:magnesium transporter n=1 Tax=Microbacterium sp. NPDC055988 TaxID=3345671 RepID=UPI0035D91034
MAELGDPELEHALDARDLSALRAALATRSPLSIARVLDRADTADRAVLYRLLSREAALEVFGILDVGMRADLFRGLRSEDVARVFEELDPDDRAQLLDELPAGQATALMRDLSPDERDLTASLLGYPRRSVGRRMTPEFVRLDAQLTVGDALTQIGHHGERAETVYSLPVTDRERRLLGAVSLRDLVLGSPGRLITEVMHPALVAHTADGAEEAARRLVAARVLALSVVDAEHRVVGMLPVGDALRILDEADDEDAARQGASEPLGLAYLATPVLRIVRSRVVWLLVLAVSALLTVQVLSAFEDTLAQVVTLALFIPLLTGTAGNTGAQAATTVTRALATGEVTTRDALAVAGREVRVGAALGTLLGGLGFVLAAIVYDIPLAAVIAVTLLAVCTLAATVGGVMPIIAKRLHADPAVFSTPFISTFCDATSLIIYFLVATWLLGL